MTFAELQDMAKADLKLSGDQLSHDAIVTPDLHNKYSRLLAEEKLKLKTLERKWDVLYLERWEYYKKKADPEVYEKEPLLKKIMDSDIKLYLAADKHLQELKARIELQEERLAFVQGCLTNIEKRNWLIRNAIDYYKFTNNVS